MPISFELVKKTEIYFDKKIQKEKRRSAKTKNEMAQEMMVQVVKNQVLFLLILFDVWFAGAENLHVYQTETQERFYLPLESEPQSGTIFSGQKSRSLDRSFNA